MIDLGQLSRRIWRSATQRVMTLTGVGLGIALLVDILIAARLGTSSTADALVIALTIPLFVDTITREGTKFSIVPLLMEHRHSLGTTESLQRVSGLVNAALVAGLGLVALIEVTAPGLVAVLGPGLAPTAKAEATRLLRICGPLMLFAFGTALLSALLNSYEFFTPVALRNALAPAAVVVTIGVAWDSRNVALWIAGAYPVGFGAFFATLFVTARRHLGYRHEWSSWPSGQDLRELFSTASWPTFGFVARRASRMVERLLASLLPPGSVAAYYFAFRIFSGVQTVIGTSLATTRLPGIVEKNLGGDRAAVSRALRGNLWRALAFSLPVMALAVTFHEQIIDLIYGRGSFDAAAIQRTSGAFLWLAVGLVFSSTIPVLQSVLYARKAYRYVFRNMVTIATTNVALAWAFSRIWGLEGIAIAVSLSSGLGVVNVLYLLHKEGVPLRQSEGSVTTGGEAS